MIAACLALGLVAAPSAVAASGNGSAKAKSSQKAKAAQKKRVTARSVNTKLNSTRKTLTSTRKSLSKVTKDFATLAASLKTEQGKVALLLSAAPQLVDGLTKLSSAVQNQIAPGLQKLGDAVEKQIAPGLQKLGDAVEKQIAPGLQDLGDYTFATEYGQIGVFIAGATTPSGGAVGTSTNIPDNGTPATASLTLPATIPAGTNIPVVARAIIRSDEADGAATGDPAGQVGALLTATCVGDTDPSDGNGATSCAGGAIPYGTIACTSGPPPNSPFNTPAGVQNLPLVNIQQKSDPLTGAATNTSTEATGGTCTIPGPGTYAISVQANFVDIPTSADPGPED